VERKLTLYRVSANGPRFAPICSWCERYEDAQVRRVQRVAETGFAPIWQAEVTIASDTFLDARDDAGRLEACLNIAGRRLRDAAHEDAEILRAQGWTCAAFTEPDQPGPEFIYLDGDAINAENAAED
jgi:hypothetical protein